MKSKTIALQLIKEDLRYHQFAAHLKQVEVYVEYFPDLAPIVISLIRPEVDEQASNSLLARYVKMVSIAKAFELKTLIDLDNSSEKIYNSLKSKTLPDIE